MGLLMRAAISLEELTETGEAAAELKGRESCWAAARERDEARMLAVLIRRTLGDDYFATAAKGPSIKTKDSCGFCGAPVPQKETPASPISGQVGEWTLEEHCAYRERRDAAPNAPDRRVAFIEKTPRVWTHQGWIYGPKGNGGSGDAQGEGTYGLHRPSRGWCDQMLLALGYDVPDPVSLPMIEVAVNLAGDYPELRTGEEVEARQRRLRGVFPEASQGILAAGIAWFPKSTGQTIPRMWGRIPVSQLWQLRRLSFVKSVYNMDEEQ